MKKGLICLAMMLLSSAAWAQETALSRFFHKYEQDTSFTVITISPRMFNMFSKVQTGDAESQEILDVAKKLTGLRILIKENAGNGMQLFKEASSLLSREYEELMTVRDKEDDLRFLVKEAPNGNIRELIMLIGSPAEFFALSLTGDIDLNEISKISQAMNIQGFDKLQNVKKQPR